ncbi:conserved hypothetical protein [Methanolacinia petrolearia DSM 11571]|uniref:Uncharacterized protein n=1 Tax=Methanolacinia petrolearia (strain DSM 11571 / OCM 486 / SEBR 4847) TaxID=679926 RepID=E1RHK4_METP4|nr:hypothetical protein [Methanolacinia petrolearia]ADN35313.1 conserved hypothetical protein [Methanolacinia petrolearia DSM 11571]
MVITDDCGQLFTIEGLVAGLIMLSAAFIVADSITIYTPGDAHIPDMQLEQLGSDALLMLDTANNYSEKSTLRTVAEMVDNGGTDAYDAGILFKDAFENELARGSGTSEIVDSIRYNATVYYRDIGSNSVMSYALGDSGTGESQPIGSEVSRQPEISTGRLIMVEDSSGLDRIYRVEVRLWRE